MTGTLFAAAYTAYLELTRDALSGTAAVVLDGPQPQLPTKKSYVAFGCSEVNLTPGSDIPAIDTGQQDSIVLGGGPRDETFAIWSVIIAWTGRNDLAACRANAFSYFEAIDSAVRMPPRGVGDAMLNETLNQSGVGTGWCGLTATKLDQFSDSTGCGVKLQTRLDCFARI